MVIICFIITVRQTGFVTVPFVGKDNLILVLPNFRCTIRIFMLNYSAVRLYNIKRRAKKVVCQ